MPSILGGYGTYIIGTDIQPGLYRCEGIIPLSSEIGWSRHGPLHAIQEILLGSDGTWQGLLPGEDPFDVEILPTDYSFTSHGMGLWNQIRGPARDFYVRKADSTWRPLTRLPDDFKIKGNFLNPDFTPGWMTNAVTGSALGPLRVRMPDGATWHEVGRMTPNAEETADVLTQVFSVDSYPGASGATGIYTSGQETTGAGAFADWTGFNDETTPLFTDQSMPVTGPAGGFEAGSRWNVRPTTEFRSLAYMSGLVDLDFAKWFVDHVCPPSTTVQLWFTLANPHSYVHTYDASDDGTYVKIAGTKFNVYSATPAYSTTLSSGVSGWPGKTVTGKGTRGALLGTCPLDIDNDYTSMTIDIDVSGGGALGLHLVCDPVLAEMVPAPILGKDIDVIIEIKVTGIGFVFNTPEHSPVLAYP